MQVIRDAVALLVIFMVVATVRVSPVPEIELSPAHASQEARPAAGFAAEVPAAAQAPNPPMAEPVDPDRPSCAQTMAARPTSRQSLDSPCNV